MSKFIKKKLSEYSIEFQEYIIKVEPKAKFIAWKEEDMPKNQDNKVMDTLQLIMKELNNIRSEIKDIKQELKSFKEEMYAFREEMYAFREEMYAFREEMYAFRDEVYMRLDRIEATPTMQRELRK